MSITNSSSARRAGFKVNNAAIKDAAAIAMSKMGVRTLYVPLTPQCFYLSGTSVAILADGIFPVILFPDANAATIATSIRLPAEWDSGTITISIYWKTTAIAGNVYLNAQIKSTAAAGTTTPAEENLLVATAAATTASQLNKSQITFLAADFTAGDLMGIVIARDPANVLDTLSADIYFVAAVLEFTGRG